MTIGDAYAAARRARQIAANLDICLPEDRSRYHAGLRHELDFVLSELEASGAEFDVHFVAPTLPAIDTESEAALFP